MTGHGGTLPSTSPLHGFDRRSASEFPRLDAAIGQLLALTDITAVVRPSADRPVFLYGSFLRAQLAGNNQFDDVDFAVASHEERTRLRSALARPLPWRDPRTGAVRYLRCDVNAANFPGVEAVVRHLNEFTMSGVVYSFADHSVWLPPRALEHVAQRLLCRPTGDAILPLKTLCRTVKYSHRGYRIAQTDLLLIHQAYRRRPWWRRIAERMFIRRHYGDQLVA